MVLTDGRPVDEDRWARPGRLSTRRWLIVAVAVAVTAVATWAVWQEVSGGGGRSSSSVAQLAAPGPSLPGVEGAAAEYATVLLDNLLVQPAKDLAKIYVPEQREQRTTELERAVAYMRSNGARVTRAVVAGVWADAYTPQAAVVEVWLVAFLDTSGTRVEWQTSTMALAWRGDRWLLTGDQDANGPVPVDATPATNPSGLSSPLTQTSAPPR